MKSKVNTKAILSVFCLVFTLVIAGCSSNESAPGTAGAQNSQALAVPGSFVSSGEFCRARLVHISALQLTDVMVKGPCYISNTSQVPFVSLIMKRALKSHGIRETQDRNSAKYLLTVSMNQRLGRARTTTSLRVVLSENNSSQSPIWTCMATVSGRGNHAVDRYAASLAGAAVYNFQQSSKHSVNRRMLNSLYDRLLSVGE